MKVAGSVQTVRYGRIGTDGHELTKTFEGPVAASKATQKLIAEKLGKGYREVSEDEATAARDAIRAANGEGAVTAPSTSAPPWQQLLLFFDEEEGVAETPMPSLPEPVSPSLLSLEF